MSYSGFFTEWIADSGYDLDLALSFAYEEYEQSFREYWELDAKEPEEWDRDEWLQVLQMSELAEKLSAGAASLVRPPRVKEEQIAFREQLVRDARERQELIDRLLANLKSQVSEKDFTTFSDVLQQRGHPADPRTKKAFFEACLQIQAWSLLRIDADFMGARLGELFQHLLRNPAPFTQAYLSRVAACYVRGMTTEFAVMARAALDTAIQEIMTDEHVIAQVGSRGRKVDLERRIEACIAKDLLSPETGRVAHKVRENGRDAAHFTPGLETRIQSLLRDLVDVLRELEANRPR